MKVQKQLFTLNIAQAQEFITHHIKQLSEFSNKTQKLYFYTLTDFLSFLRRHSKNQDEFLIFDETTVLNWMKEIARKYRITRIHFKYSILSHFLQGLTENKIVSDNPMSAIKDRFGKRCLKSIALAFTSENPARSLKLLQVRSPFPGKFGIYAKVYLELLNAAGVKSRHIRTVLAMFSQFVINNSIASPRMITPVVVQEWIDSLAFDQHNTRNKVCTLRRFFEYLHKLHVVRANPVTDAIMDNIGHPVSSFQPYIYTVEEIKMLLWSATQIPSNYLFKLKPQVLYTVIAMLYTLGLRLNEVLNLTLMDVDFVQGTIFIRDSKFHKDRVIPFGPKMGAHLNKYISLRRQIFKPVKPVDYLFIARQRFRVSDGHIRCAFSKLIKSRQPNDPYRKAQPRLHDLRHTFAVHRLLQWYKDGVEVQNKLPLLSTFMGHVDIYSTQVYLSITEDLLKEANDRFRLNFGKKFDEEILL